jgi:hypothetical protein
MRRLLFVLELFLALESLDESLLREILRVVDIAHHAVDLEKDSPHIVGDKPIL